MKPRDPRARLFAEAALRKNPRASFHDVQRDAKAQGIELAQHHFYSARRGLGITRSSKRAKQLSDTAEFTALDNVIESMRRLECEREECREALVKIQDVVAEVLLG